MQFVNYSYMLLIIIDTLSEQNLVTFKELWRMDKTRKLTPNKQKYTTHVKKKEYIHCTLSWSTKKSLMSHITYELVLMYHLSKHTESDQATRTQ